MVRGAALGAAATFSGASETAILCPSKIADYPRSEIACSRITSSVSGPVRLNAGEKPHQGRVAADGFDIQRLARGELRLALAQPDMSRLINGVREDSLLTRVEVDHDAILMILEVGIDARKSKRFGLDLCTEFGAKDLYVYEPPVMAAAERVEERDPLLAGDLCCCYCRHD